MNFLHLKKHRKISNPQNKNWFVPFPLQWVSRTIVFTFSVLSQLYEIRHATLKLKRCTQERTETVFSIQSKMVCYSYHTTKALLEFGGIVKKSRAFPWFQRFEWINEKKIEMHTAHNPDTDTKKKRRKKLCTGGNSSRNYGFIWRYLSIIAEFFPYFDDLQSYRTEYISI